MQVFEYVRATDAGQAIAEVVGDPRSAYLAGGMTQVDLMKDGVLSPDRLIDISRLPLRGITRGDGAIRVGGLTTMEEFAAEPIVRERLPMVRKALLLGASVQLRNLATIGGILCLPILIAADLSLLDTIDGSFMNFAYGWASSKPVRKVYYNVAIIGLSVAVALITGTIELLSLAADELSPHGGLWDWVSGININTLGYPIGGLFVVTWVGALAIWRFGRIEGRWAAGIRRANRRRSDGIRPVPRATRRAACGNADVRPPVRLAHRGG